MTLNQIVDILKPFLIEIKKSNNSQTKTLMKEIRTLNSELSTLKKSNRIILNELKQIKQGGIITERETVKSLDDVVGDVLSSARTQSHQHTTEPKNILQNILEETARTTDFSEMNDPYDDYPTMNNTPFTANTSTAIPGINPTPNVRTDLISNTDPEGKRINLKAVPEKVLQNIAMKDYGPMMDRILAKEKAQRKG